MPAPEATPVVPIVSALQQAAEAMFRTNGGPPITAVDLDDIGTGIAAFLRALHEADEPTVEVPGATIYVGGFAALADAVMEAADAALAEEPAT